MAPQKVSLYHVHIDFLAGRSELHITIVEVVKALHHEGGQLTLLYQFLFKTGIYLGQPFGVRFRVSGITAAEQSRVGTVSTLVYSSGLRG